MLRLVSGARAASVSGSVAGWGATTTSFASVCWFLFSFANRVTWVWLGLFIVFVFFANPVTTAVATTAVATSAATDLEAPGFDHLAARGDDHFQAPGEQQFASRCNKL